MSFEIGLPYKKMVEVFATDVREAFHAEAIIDLLLQHFPGSKINFDLEDCDKILRVEGTLLSAEKVVFLVEGKGFSCRVLE